MLKRKSARVVSSVIAGHGGLFFSSALAPLHFYTLNNFITSLSSSSQIQMFQMCHPATTTSYSFRRFSPEFQLPDFLTFKPLSYHPLSNYPWTFLLFSLVSDSVPTLITSLLKPSVPWLHSVCHPCLEKAKSTMNSTLSLSELATKLIHSYLNKYFLSINYLPGPI